LQRQAKPTSPRQAHTSARDYDVDMELLDRLIVSSPAALRAGLAHNWPALPPAPFIPVAHRIELLARSLSLCRVVGPALNAKVPALNLFFPGAERFLQTAVYTNSAHFCSTATAAFMANLCRITPLNGSGRDIPFALREEMSAAFHLFYRIG